MYPTENLEDFYDKEDIEMENLKDDKGTWLIRSK